MSARTRWRWSVAGLLVLALAACTPEPVGPVERCDDGADQDGDDLIDCADPDCTGQCPELCADALDNDGDGMPDCADPDCDGSCPEACGDGRDNDGDFRVDCADADCVGLCPEDCANGIDDDGDFLPDCLDSDCSAPSCPEVCTDGRDNDGDGLADCADPACDGGCAEDCADGRDNDGDALVDCADPACDGGCPEACTDGRDNDGDGILDCQDPDCAGRCDGDGDGYEAAGGGGPDCDDLDPEVHPGAAEGCDGVDNDCDGLIDDQDPVLDGPGTVDVHTDADGDGWGGAVARSGCAAGAGESLLGGDCDDTAVERSPGAIEVCGGGDQDCDQLIDDADPSLDPASATVWYEDVDGDGHGDPSATWTSCVRPAGYVAEGDDCHVFDPDVFEVRDWWIDGDGDGYGAGLPVSACVQPLWRVDVAGDCDDTDPELHPETLWYVDADLDGYGDPEQAVASCTPVVARIRDGSDCDDGDPQVHPGAGEAVCDGVDEDCDGLVDGADPDFAGAGTWYRDQDGDGFGDPASPIRSCAPPEGAVANADDTCPRVPDAPAVDADADGFGPACDCDDGDPALHPGVLGAWPSLLAAFSGDGTPEDVTGQLPPPIVVGAPGYGPGVYGDAFVLDGVDDAVTAALARTEPFTLAFWARAERFGQPAGRGVVAAALNDAMPNTFQVGIGPGETYEVQSGVTGGIFPVGDLESWWVHVAVAWDGTVVHTWRDGQPVASVPWPGVGPMRFSGLAIGRDRSATLFFEGGVDDVLVFDRALGDAEIAALFDGTAVCLGL